MLIPIGANLLRSQMAGYVIRLEVGNDLHSEMRIHFKMGSEPKIEDLPKIFGAAFIRVLKMIERPEEPGVHRLVDGRIEGFIWEGDEHQVTPGVGSAGAGPDGGMVAR